MFVRSGVENYLRAIFGKNVFHFSVISHARYQCDEIEIAEFPFEFLFDVVSIVLVNIENDEPFGVVACYLTA